MTALRKPTGLRTVTAATCGTLGVLLILVGGLLAYGERSLFDSRVFADKAAQSLADPRVASYAASQITDAVLLAGRDLTMVRPIIHATAEFVVSSGPFRAIARSAFRRGHELMLTEKGQGILLSVSDVGVVLRSALATRPELAKMIPNKIDAVLEARKGDPLLDLSSRLIRLGNAAGSYAQILFWLGVTLLLASLLIAANTKLAVFRSGVALVVAGLLTLLLVRYGGSVIAAMVEDKALGGALAGVWDTFTIGLRSRALALGGVGILMTAASTAVLDRVKLDAIVRALRGIFWNATDRKSVRLLRAAALLAFGAMAVLEPQTLASMLVVLAGGSALFVGFREIFHLILPPSIEQVGRERTPGARSHIVRYALAGAIVLSVVVVSVHVIIRSPDISSVLRTVDACNGHPSLADRRLNEVVFPASHNAMSSADISTWMFPNQERGIRSQLEYGIRGLLFDVYAGTPVGGAVKTDLGGEEGIAREKYVPMLGEQGVDAAIRIRDRMVEGKESNRALYLCHGLCELGATPLVVTLAGIREFLVMNPNEVLIIVIEDYVEPQEIEAAFEESGLIDFVFRGEPRPPWPTLREMVLADEQVLVLAEHNSEGVDWYHQANEVLQETPYHFKEPEEFSNVPNRGGTSGSLLLMNHWIATEPSSLPSNAEIVNAYDVLLTRARACEKERDKLPNLIAVDFHRTGDLLRVVSTLNGIPEPDDNVLFRQ